MWLYEKLQIKPEKDGPMEKNIFKREEIVSVLTDQPINEGLLSYLVPIDFISVGQFVEIPIGSRSCVGVVWGSSSIKLDSNRLKYISRILEVPPMSPELRKFFNQLAIYTINPLNKVFKLSLCASECIDKVLFDNSRPNLHHQLSQISKQHIIFTLARSTRLEPTS